ncbi:hypothetical protein HY480_00390 [Candidatus Uhrbacteria bacterium]|nr:hypothetical protein [Candidatus Uhrbacteria bacterium]
MLDELVLTVIGLLVIGGMLCFAEADSRWAYIAGMVCGVAAAVLAGVASNPGFGFVIAWFALMLDGVALAGSRRAKRNDWRSWQFITGGAIVVVWLIVTFVIVIVEGGAP